MLSLYPPFPINFQLLHRSPDNSFISERRPGGARLRPSRELAKTWNWVWFRTLPARREPVALPHRLIRNSPPLSIRSRATSTGSLARKSRRCSRAASCGSVGEGGRQAPAEPVACETMTQFQAFASSRLGGSLALPAVVREWWIERKHSTHYPLATIKYVFSVALSSDRYYGFS